MKRSRFYFILSILVVSLSLKSQTIKDQSQRQVLNLNAQWAYLEDDVENISGLVKTKEKWTEVNLPHTWNRFDAVDQIPGYRRAASWYKKELVVPACKNNLRFILSFEGVNIKSQVFVNGKRAGEHIGGYIGFDLDITPLVKLGSKNTILIRADNSYDPDVIPSQKSDFHIYGGITRNVWLIVVPGLYIEAVKINTPKVSKLSAETIAEVKVVNTGTEKTSAEIEIALNDRSGKQIQRKTMTVELPKGITLLPVMMAAVKNPTLWSPSDPALHSIVVSLNENKKVVDSIKERFGYRWFEFKEHGPFYLNGERLLLRGTHRHEDYAGLANAMPDSLHRKDMRMIKEMGANFVRLAHYPQSPEVYRACDELGILVWDELPWCRGGMGGDAWKANTKRLLREQIERHFNHPSIIIHSLGNELYWLPDVPGGDNMDSLRAMVRELNTISHQLDPYRLTATRKFTEGADFVDVVSPSLWPGWYSGVYKGFEKAITDSKNTFAHFFHAEYGGDSHVGRHTENPVSGDGFTTTDGWEEQIKPQKVKNVAQLSDWSESYIVDLFDWYLHISEQKDWFTGNAQWAFKDFPTPLRPENPIPYVNQKGLLDRSGKPKDAYYVFKSYWTTSPKFCYIESHSWTERSGPSGTKREVNVFSNCSEVELFLNGLSQGKMVRDIQKFPACGLNWQVGFAEGENFIKAIGYKNGTSVCVDSMVVAYSYKKAEEPDQIVLKSEPLPSGNLLITATVVDKSGRRCLEYNKRVYFSKDGAGTLVQHMGTPTGSSVIEFANGKARIEFVPDPKKKTVIEARNQDFKGSYLIVNP
jgi:beta-galactosidase